MACNLINGAYSFDCDKNADSGVIEIYIGNFDASTVYTFDGDNTISGINPAMDVYNFKIPAETAEYKSDYAYNAANRAGVYTQVFSFSLMNLDIPERNQLLNLAKSDLTVAIKTVSGKYILMGVERAVDLTKSAVSSGVKLDDASKFTLELTYRSTVPTQFLDPAIVGSDLVITL